MIGTRGPAASGDGAPAVVGSDMGRRTSEAHVATPSSECGHRGFQPSKPTSSKALGPPVRPFINLAETDESVLKSA